MGKVNNALKMLAILRSRKRVTRKEIAEELEVGIREVSRYKDDLESAGVTITNIKGKHGGYVLEHKDYLLNLELSKTEEHALEQVEQYVKKTTFPFYKELRAALHKIKAIHQQPTQLTETVFLHDKSAKAKIKYEEEREKWLVLNDGIINSKKARIVYEGAKGTTSERIIHPYALFTYYEANYVIAWCEVKRDFRQFKFMRIQQLERLNEKFVKQPFQLDTYVKETMGLMKEGWQEERINMKLKIYYPYAKAFGEVTWMQNEIITDCAEDGYIIYEASAYGKSNIVHWVLGMGRFCEVLEPTSLQNAIIEEYDYVKKMYNRTI